jgi:hypothetical protein
MNLRKSVLLDLDFHFTEFSEVRVSWMPIG